MMWYGAAGSAKRGCSWERARGWEVESARVMRVRRFGLFSSISFGDPCV